MTLDAGDEKGREIIATRIIDLARSGWLAMHDAHLFFRLVHVEFSFDQRASVFSN
jgi:hypothetical protein